MSGTSEGMVMNKRIVFNDDHVEVLCGYCERDRGNEGTAWDLVMQETDTNEICQVCADEPFDEHGE